MGRASNRKKAQRRAGPSSRQGSRADAATQQAMRQLAGVLQTLVEEAGEREEREGSARRAWCGGAEPVAAETPRWPEDSLGDRFFGGAHMEQARTAPCLLTAQIPDAAVIAADPGHWNVAANALIRAVAFDGLALDHPAVRTLLEALAPIAEAELAYGEVMEAWLDKAGPRWDDEAGPTVDEDEPEFPELDGPVFLLGVCALSALAQLCRSGSASVLQPAA